MKKLISFISILLVSFSLFSQEIPEPNQQKNLSFIPISSAPDALNYGFAGGQRTILWADDNLKTIVNIHTVDSVNNPYLLGIDVSFDGGETFQSDIPVFNGENGSPNPYYARFPQGGIINPPGNTDPANAVYAYFAPVSQEGSGEPTKYCYGTINLGDFSDTTQNIIESHDEYNYGIPDGFTVTQDGVVWVVDINRHPDSANYVYSGTLIVLSGIFNETSGDIEFEEFLLDLPTQDNQEPLCVRVAFAPDGVTGYIVALTNNGSQPFSQGAYYPVVFKTTDGGQTWEDPFSIQLGGAQGMSDLVYGWLTDSQIEEFFGSPVPERDEILYTTAYDFDLVVDIHNLPHIAVVIGIGDGEYNLITAQDYIGAFDIFHPDYGDTWEVHWASNFNTFRGTFGDFSEDNRIQASTTMDGNIVTIAWADTHYEGIVGNNMPDIFCRHYNVVQYRRTEAVNITEFTQAWLEAYSFSMPLYMFFDEEQTWNIYQVPFTYINMDPINPLEPVTCIYIENYGFGHGDWIIPYGAPSYNNSLIGNISIYPNPTRNDIFIKVGSDISGEVTIRLSNASGQTVLLENYSGLSAGVHDIKVGSENLPNGIYFMSIITSNNIHTLKFISF